MSAARLTVYHLTPVRRLPNIEEEGLRTRADLSGVLGPIGPEDEAAPGAFAHGRRVSAYLDRDHAATTVDQHGHGLVSFTVDPAKALAAPASARGDDPSAYWSALRPLRSWLQDGDVPNDLEVHQNVAVRPKHLRLQAALLDEDALGPYASLVAAVADADRVSAKALMHLALIASDGGADTDEFRAAVALAWRDEPDDPRINRELAELDPDKVASAALAEHAATAPVAVESLREALATARTWGDEQQIPHGRALFARSVVALEGLSPA